MNRIILTLGKVPKALLLNMNMASTAMNFQDYCSRPENSTLYGQNIWIHGKGLSQLDQNMYTVILLQRVAMPILFIGRVHYDFLYKVGLM